MYKVKIEQFEGPLDLLLEIIEAKKLALHQIPLAQIVDQFIDYLSNSLTRRTPEELVEFLVVASRLVLLKSRELVPEEKITDEEEGNINLLKKQLSFYQLFRKSAKELRRQEQQGESFHAREAFAGFKSIFYFPRGLKTKHLTGALETLLAAVTLPKKIPQARIKDTISIAQCIKELSRMLENKKTVNFSELFVKWEADKGLINFLGVLELARLGKINPTQKSNFGTIILTRLT